jgi:hypothetical protein
MLSPSLGALRIVQKLIEGIPKEESGKREEIEN